MTTIIPAAEGWFVLWPIRHANGELALFERVPVVAWLVVIDEPEDASPIAVARPVCAEELPEAWFLRQPDGVVFSPNAGWWPDQEAAIRDLRRRPEWASR